MFRLPYLKMPLTVDTGYHVPPATVSQKRFHFINDWSSWAAGCSKVLPSWFYQLCYLASPKNYKVAFRIGHAGLYWITAAIIGRLVYELGGNGLFAFVAFGLLSAQPHWGASYYEASESFHPLMQAGGLLAGMLVHPAIGGFILFCDVYFVKLSALPTALLLSFMLGLWTVPGILVASLLYVLWIRVNNAKPSALYAILSAQQEALKYNDHWTDRIYRKVSILLEQIWTNPSFPIAALAGMLYAPLLPFAWIAGNLAQAFMQTNVVWYFSFPLIAPIAVLSGFAPEQVFYGTIVLYLALWAIRMRQSELQRYLWVWKLHSEHAEVCWSLDKRAKNVKIDNFFVLGPETQLYVLHDGAYPTPFVSGSWFIEHMFPSWTQYLNRQWLKNPPDWIVDTTGAFDPKNLCDQTGLIYELDVNEGADFYQYKGKEPRVSAIVSAYYAAPYLEGRLKNLLNQTEVPEIIVVCQSGSPEHVIALKYWDRIKIVETEDIPTIYKAWNLGIEQATGKYIFNANSDDRCQQEFVEIMADALLVREDAAVVYADSWIVREIGGQPIGKFEWAEGGMETLKEGCFLGPMPMWRKSLHDEYGYFDEDMKSAGDYEFWLRLAEGGEYFHHLRVPLGTYLRRLDGAELRDQQLSVAERREAVSRHE